MKVLLVDDIPTTRIVHSKLIEKINPSCEVEHADSYEEAVLKNLSDYDMIITDNILRRKTGADLVNYIKSSKINTKIVLLTGWHFLDDELQRLKVPIFHKPVSLAVFKKIIDTVA